MNRLRKTENGDSFRGKLNGRPSPFVVTMRLIGEMKKRKPRPICAKCGKGVDEFELETTADDQFFHFTAFCHGKTQSFKVHKGYFLFAEDWELGRAFEDDTPKTIDFDRRLLDGPNDSADT